MKYNYRCIFLKATKGCFCKWDSRKNIVFKKIKTSKTHLPKLVKFELGIK